MVCGAPNARAGLKTVFAAPGTHIPAKNITIAKGVIRGVESGGMMCSPEELGLEGDSSGIFELPADAPVGEGYAAWAGPRRSADRDQPHPQPLGRGQRFRHRPRPRRGGAGEARSKTPITPVVGAFACPVTPKLDLAPEDAKARAAVRAAARARRKKWPEPGLAARAAEEHRPAPDQRAGRHHQFHDV